MPCHQISSNFPTPLTNSPFSPSFIPSLYMRSAPLRNQRSFHLLFPLSSLSNPLSTPFPPYHRATLSLSPLCLRFILPLPSLSPSSTLSSRPPSRSTGGFTSVLTYCCGLFVFSPYGSRRVEVLSSDIIHLPTPLFAPLPHSLWLSLHPPLLFLSCDITVRITFLIF